MTYLIPLCNECKNLLGRDFDAEGYIYPYFILCSVAMLNNTCSLSNVTLVILKRPLHCYNVIKLTS
jgi:hypothetical protein